MFPIKGTISPVARNVWLIIHKFIEMVAPNCLNQN